MAGQNSGSQLRPRADIIRDVSTLRIADSNEAETRKKLIDEILFGVLGWQHDDVSFEERVSEDGKTVILDYTCITAQTSILVEAKRIGISFDGLPKTRRLALKGTWSKGEIGAAVRQARDYGRHRS